MRLPALLLAVSALAVSPSAAQQLTKADSNLVYAILTAEDRRDSMAPALTEGMRHADARIRVLAERATGRITDSTYAGRSTLPPSAPRYIQPMPTWRARFDSLRIRRDDCRALRSAVDDSLVQVRIRAWDLVRAGCDTAQGLRELALIRAALDLPPSRTVHPRPWQEGAHALVAAARLWPAGIRNTRVIGQYAQARRSGPRVYGAMAARMTHDTSMLRQLAHDRDGNVAEAAVDGLAAVAGHSEDSTYIRVLRSASPPAVRAAATALKGSTDPATRPALDRAIREWLARANDSERDVRLALLDAAGRPATDDRRWSTPAPLPREVVALALGAERRLKVTMDGGASFVIKLRGDVAPITGARVLALARSRYYDGTTWHRVVSDFVLQGGGHGANEYVGYPRYFRDELGTVSHLRGGVGMSTRGHDTGDAQWFIDLGDNQRLDKDYTLFGEVVEGMDVVDGVLEGTRIATIRLVR